MTLLVSATGMARYAQSGYITHASLTQNPILGWFFACCNVLSEHSCADDLFSMNMWSQYMLGISFQGQQNT